MRLGTAARALDRLEDPATPVVEFAHNGQLPHLGVIRCLLKAAELAEEVDGVCLYAIGNHYTSAMGPRDLYVGVPFEGRPPEDVRRPIRFSVGKANEDVPFSLLPPPSADAVAELEARTAERVAANVRAERESGVAVRDPDAMAAAVHDLFSGLARAAAEVASFGDWLLRAQDDLLRSMPFRDRTILFPMGEVHLPLLPELRRLAALDREIAAVKSEGASVEPVGSSGWLACPQCGRRSRTEAITAELVRHRCGACGRETREGWQALAPRFAPDIVLWQLTLAQAGIHGWVVGSEASYLPIIAAAHRRLLGSEAAPAFVLQSVPTFRGVGDPPEGYGRTRLLRALFEMPAPAVFDALLAPWPESPSLRSPHLG
jgi:hypothetical protein